MPLLTIGEIAALVRHLAADPFAVVDRARHWAKIGLLHAVENVGEGGGKHQRFLETEAYMAAVVLALAEAGFQPAGSRAVADAQSFARTTLANWLCNGRPQPKLLRVRSFPRGRGLIEVFPPDLADEISEEELTGMQERTAALAREWGAPMTTIEVDLGFLFASVFERIERRSEL
jgi:hypothetical protein